MEGGGENSRVLPSEVLKKKMLIRHKNIAAEVKY
jgi:hypothetical protein